MQLDKLEKKLDDAWIRYDKAVAEMMEIHTVLFDVTVAFYGEKRKVEEGVSKEK